MSQTVSAIAPTAADIEGGADLLLAVKTNAPVFPARFPLIGNPDAANKAILRGAIKKADLPTTVATFQMHAFASPNGWKMLKTDPAEILPLLMVPTDR